MVRGTSLEGFLAAVTLSGDLGAIGISQGGEVGEEQHSAQQVQQETERTSEHSDGAQRVQRRGEA